MRPVTEMLIWKRVLHAVQLFVLVSAPACAVPEAGRERVSYIDAPPIGAWSFEPPPLPVAGGAGSDELAGAGGSPPIGGMGGAGGGEAEPPAITQLRFSVTTRELNGLYAPKNIGAIWISDAEGRHIRTLELWASIRRRYLTRWNAATGGDRADVVSRATLRMHETHEVLWDLTDKTGAHVAPGAFELTIETTDRSGTGQFLSVPFTLGMPFELMPPDTPYYVSMRLAAE